MFRSERLWLRSCADTHIHAALQTRSGGHTRINYHFGVVVLVLFRARTILGTDYRGI
ncbi:hypothetical protein L209DRAFT_520727 [Thermothelomyces heterothallicus CBS 203.75]